VSGRLETPVGDTGLVVVTEADDAGRAVTTVKWPPFDETRDVVIHVSLSRRECAVLADSFEGRHTDDSDALARALLMAIVLQATIFTRTGAEVAP